MFPVRLTGTAIALVTVSMLTGVTSAEASICLRDNPCKNGGQCVPWRRQDSFFCRCAKGYSGKTCTQTSICLRDNPCKNGGRCVPWGRQDRFFCRCATGYRGKTCTQKDPCKKANPCQNKGRCWSFRLFGSWKTRCRCTTGFHGRFCEKEYNNICVREKPCMNGGRCRTVGCGRGYKCYCPWTYAGVNCTAVDPCLTTKNFCLNGGRCRSSRTRNNSWHQRCDCRGGFQGKRCQGCQGFKCYNGGTCYSFGPKHARCSCTRGHRGRHCEQKICSIDASRCRVANRKPNPNNFTECRKYTQQQYQNETTCLHNLYEELIAKKDCACTKDDVTRLLFSRLNTDPTLHVAWHCITEQPALNQPGCAKGTIQCGEALIEAYRYQSPICNKSLWETANRCYREFQRGQLPLAGCSAYQYFFETFGLTGKLSVDMICSECKIFQKILPCVVKPNRKTNDICDYFVVSRINATVQCFANNIRKDVKCNEVANDALIYAINKMKVVAHNTRCEQARKYGEMRDGWGCDKPVPPTSVPKSFI